MPPKLKLGQVKKKTKFEQMSDIRHETLSGNRGFKKFSDIRHSKLGEQEPVIRKATTLVSGRHSLEATTPVRPKKPLRAKGQIETTPELYIDIGGSQQPSGDIPPLTETPLTVNEPPMSVSSRISISSPEANLDIPDSEVQRRMRQNFTIQTGEEASYQGIAQRRPLALGSTPETTTGVEERMRRSQIRVQREGQARLRNEAITRRAALGFSSSYSEIPPQEQARPTLTMQSTESTGQVNISPARQTPRMESTTISSVSEAPRSRELSRQSSISEFNIPPMEQPRRGALYLQEASQPINIPKNEMYQTKKDEPEIQYIEEEDNSKEDTNFNKFANIRRKKLRDTNFNKFANIRRKKLGRAATTESLLAKPVNLPSTPKQVKLPEFSELPRVGAFLNIEVSPSLVHTAKNTPGKVLPRETIENYQSPFFESNVPESLIPAAKLRSVGENEPPFPESVKSMTPIVTGATALKHSTRKELYANRQAAMNNYTKLRTESLRGNIGQDIVRGAANDYFMADQAYRIASGRSIIKNREELFEKMRNLIPDIEEDYKKEKSFAREYSIPIFYPQEKKRIKDIRDKRIKEANEKIKIYNTSVDVFAKRIGSGEIPSPLLRDQRIQRERETASKTIQIKQQKETAEKAEKQKQFTTSSEKFSSAVEEHERFLTSKGHLGRLDPTDVNSPAKAWAVYRTMGRVTGDQAKAVSLLNPLTRRTLADVMRSPEFAAEDVGIMVQGKPRSLKSIYETKDIQGRSAQVMSGYLSENVGGFRVRPVPKKPSGRPSNPPYEPPITVRENPMYASQRGGIIGSVTARGREVYRSQGATGGEDPFRITEQWGEARTTRREVANASSQISAYSMPTVRRSEPAIIEKEQMPSYTVNKGEQTQTFGERILQSAAKDRFRGRAPGGVVFPKRSDPEIYRRKMRQRYQQLFGG